MTASTPTTIPTAITNFLALATEAVQAMPVAVQVLASEPRLADPAYYLSVTGWETEQRGPSTIGTGASAGYFLIEERYVLIGQIFAWNGGSDYGVTLGIAAEIMTLVEQAVRLNPTLNGAVRVTWFSQWTGVNAPSETQNGGSTTTVPFELHCEAQI